MKTKTFICAILSMVALSFNCFGKIRYFTIGELIDNANVIVVAEIKIVDGQPVANVIKKIKGDPEEQIKLRNLSAQNMDNVEYKDAEKTLLFLDILQTDGYRCLIGHGDQAKWPKYVENYGFKKSFFSTINKVTEAVEILVKTQGNTDLQTSALHKMLTSNDVFYEAVALQYMIPDSSSNLRNTLREDIEKLQQSPDLDIKELAVLLLTYIERDDAFEEFKLNRDESLMNKHNVQK